MKNSVVLMTSFCTILGTVAHAKSVGDIQKEITTLLAHEPKVTNINMIRSLGLDQAKSKSQPWTGGYWPDITGSIANHYRDHTKIGNQIGFVLRYGVAKNRFLNDHKDVSENFASWDLAKRDQKLSPSEKYDLLVGNKNFEFTQGILGELDFRSEHRVVKLSNGDFGWAKKGKGFAYWSGICDGWAPASIYLPRPTHPVTVTGASGYPITFYPDDLKALGAYLFARANTPYFSTMSYKFAGNACRQKGQPEQDENGLIPDAACNDLDAGMWHLALVNRIGLDRMGFEMDVDNNVKINNHPIFEYSLSYFNPKTGKKGSMKESIVARSDFSSDLYASKRDPKAVAIVGVKSKVRFGFYVWPEEHRHVEVDSPAEDKTKTAEYTYDLELDADGNILGGEWGDRSKEKPVVTDSDAEGESSEDSKKGGIEYAKQPDFIWMAPVDQLPYSQMSLSTSKGSFKDNAFTWAWTGNGEIPEDWLLAAREDQKWEAPAVNDGYSKLKSAQALSNLVYVLFEMAK